MEWLPEPEGAELHPESFNSTSEFFRDPWSFALLEHHLLAERLCVGPLRIWSAGCAAGQEALSLAILIEKLGATFPHARSSVIFATDASAPPLEQARRGRYPGPQLQSVPLGAVQRWFTPEQDDFIASPALLARVHFSRHDLLDARTFSPPEAIFGAFDLICCANVLLYYKLDAQGRILRKVHQALTPSGLLMVGPSETGIVAQSGLFVRQSDGPFFKPVAGVACEE